MLVKLIHSAFPMSSIYAFPDECYWNMELHFNCCSLNSQQQIIYVYKEEIQDLHVFQTSSLCRRKFLEVKWPEFILILVETTPQVAQNKNHPKGLEIFDGCFLFLIFRIGMQYLRPLVTAGVRQLRFPCLEPIGATLRP